MTESTVEKLVEELSEELVQELLDNCPCRATKNAEGKVTTKYTCKNAEQRNLLARVLEQPSIIEVARQVEEISRTALD